MFWLAPNCTDLTKKENITFNKMSQEFFNLISPKYAILEDSW